VLVYVTRFGYSLGTIPNYAWNAAPDLGFTRDRQVERASRPQPTCVAAWSQLRPRFAAARVSASGNFHPWPATASARAKIAGASGAVAKSVAASARVRSPLPSAAVVAASATRTTGNSAKRFSHRTALPTPPTRTRSWGASASAMRKTRIIGTRSMQRSGAPRTNAARRATRVRGNDMRTIPIIASATAPRAAARREVSGAGGGACAPCKNVRPLISSMLSSPAGGRREKDAAPPAQFLTTSTEHFA